MTNVFDGAALVRGVPPDPDIEERRIALFTTLIAAALPDEQPAEA